ncbi:hypothetical protein BWQ96_02349 [Gracilariopsis chorda]|uniref:Uncharacterized protein n=1 Tax=Gracilariopsis chorda TaxID=448386 RepID=A0A2V3J0Y5_9FLOR|nr:hypothetical protein BWQ96_02349 [Gracilariopsis chorda]|eukprot:PXF47963.1 hypothetical protein BWQ96_02349 [Gracilariopsis chorda]
MAADTESPETKEESTATRFFGRSFRAGVPLRKVFDRTQELFGQVAWRTATAQNALLRETILYQSDSTRCIPGFHFGHSRCARFLRLLMDEVDRASEGSVDESLVEIAAEYCMRTDYPERNVYIVLDMPNDEERVLVVSELFSDIGARVWEAGLVMYSQLSQTKSPLQTEIAGATILELGAGTGVTGSAYISAGAKRVLLTDYKEDVVNRIQQNIQNNKMAPRVEARILDAGDLPRLRELINEHDVDVITAADVTYDDNLLKIMIRALADAVKRTRVGYLLATSRHQKTDSLLRTELTKSGMCVIEAPTMVPSSSYEYILGSDLSTVKAFRLRHSPKNEGSFCDLRTINDSSKVS